MLLYCIYFLNKLLKWVVAVCYYVLKICPRWQKESKGSSEPPRRICHNIGENSINHYQNDEIMLVGCRADPVRASRCFELWVNWATGQAWLEWHGPVIWKEQKLLSWPTQPCSPPCLDVYCLLCRALPPQTWKHQKTTLMTVKWSGRRGETCLAICLKCLPCGCQKLSRCHSRDDQFIARNE